MRNTGAFALPVGKNFMKDGSRYNLNPTFNNTDLKFFDDAWDAWTGLIQLNTSNTAGASTVSFDTTTDFITTPDPLIDWLPYHYKKYLPTWHLVRSYQHD